MFKIVVSLSFAALLSFSCTDNNTATETPPTTENETVRTTPPTTEIPNQEELREEPLATTEPSTETTITQEPAQEEERPKTTSSKPKNQTPPATKEGTTAETGKSTPSKTIDAKPMPPALSHDKLDGLLRKHVSSSGKVDYRTFKKDQSVLADYLNALQLNAPTDGWSKNKEMAYWINLYNAFTIHTILENYPVSSITNLEGGKVWDRKTIKIGNETLTLNQIEKQKLLKRFKDPRVHFAVNCAAASCPPLLNKAWTEDNLQRYLQQQTKSFINNGKENILEANSIMVSQIFDWYADDFGGKEKIVGYFQKYADTKINDGASVTFNEYNWDLND